MGQNFKKKRPNIGDPHTWGFKLWQIALLCCVACFFLQVSDWFPTFVDFTDLWNPRCKMCREKIFKKKTLLFSRWYTVTVTSPDKPGLKGAVSQGGAREGAPCSAVRKGCKGTGQRGKRMRREGGTLVLFSFLFFALTFQSCSLISWVCYSPWSLRGYTWCHGGTERRMWWDNVPVWMWEGGGSPPRLPNLLLKTQLHQLYHKNSCICATRHEHELFSTVCHEIRRKTPVFTKC